MKLLMISTGLIVNPAQVVSARSSGVGDELVLELRMAGDPVDSPSVMLRGKDADEMFDRFNASDVLDGVGTAG